MSLLPSNIDPRQLVVVGLSGGVDSAVAALLLLEQGYTVEGLFMKNWEEDDSEHYCSAAADLADAQAVADILGIPLHRVNFASEYWDQVFSHFLDEYRAGRTPNPDVLCNREIKFKAFLDYAIGQLGAQRIATGHYARLGANAHTYLLQRAADENKDQTYFLYLLGQRELASSLFPLGGMQKQEVRRRAEAKKKDSTGICFIGERKFRDFLSRYLPAKPGIIEDPAGKPIGRHLGLMYYTIGQRQGLGIGGRQDSLEAPWFVVGKDLEHNVLIAAQGHDTPLLLHHRLLAEQLHWISGKAPAFPLACQARIRHRQPLQECEIRTAGPNHCEVIFAQAQRAITPGQSVVFYQEANCLGGGIIAATDRD